MSPPFRGRLLSGQLLVLGAGEAASRVFTFVAMGYLIRTLGDEHYGRLETTLAVMMFCSLVVDLGQSVLGAREIASGRVSEAGYVARVVSLQLGLAVLTLAGLAATVYLLPLSGVRRHLLIGFGLSLLALPFSLHWVFQGRGQMLWFALPRAVRYALFLLVALLLVHEPGDVWRLPAAEVAAVGGMGLVFILAYRRGGQRLTLVQPFDRELLREGLPVGGSNLIWALRMYLPFLLLDGLAGPAAVALYGASHRILMVYQGGLDVYFTRLLPLLSRAASGSAAELRGLLWRSTHLLLWPTLLLAAAVTVAAEPIMGLIFAAAESGGALLAVLFWLAPVLALRRHGRLALITLGRQRGELVCSVLGLLLLVVLLIPWTRQAGVAGAAQAMLLSEGVATALTWVLLIGPLRR